jgi:hypothetical protein
VTRHAPVGSRLRAWAERHCSPEVLNTLILPVVADLQFEDALWRGDALSRWVLRCRGYLGIAQALGLHYICDGRASVKHSKFALLRLGLMIPAALVAAFAAQIIVGRGLGIVLGVLWRRNITDDWLIWAAKTVTSPFMSAAFFGAMWWVAPPTRRSVVAVGALVAVLLWGGLLIFGAVTEWPRFHGWLFNMGLALWLGGGVTFWLVRRVRPA